MSEPFGWPPVLISLNGESAAVHWQEARIRAAMLRRVREQLHPALAAELAELERYGC